MSETLLEPHQKTILALFEQAKNGRLSASDIQKKLGLTSKNGPKDGLDAPAANGAITGLIAMGLIEVASGAKDGPYPRARASYRLTENGKQHLSLFPSKLELRPARPDHSDEQLQYQESFILLKVFSAQPLTQSQLKGKLKTNAAKRQLELDVVNAPETISYHLAELVEKGCLLEERSSNSFTYSLTKERGIRALATGKQHTEVTFQLSGVALNALIAAIGQAKPAEPRLEVPAVMDEPDYPLYPRSEPLGPMDILRYVELLLSDKYAGKDLIPIHEVRRLVAEHQGTEAAGHPVFDPLIKRMRTDRQLRLIAISDNRDATQEQLNDSIPGMNEILFYIVIR